MASASLAGSSSMRTTSAASMAASEPRAPIATPISALERTGASLIPSPTNARFSFAPFSPRSLSTCATLSAGRSSLCISSRPSSVPTRCAVLAVSPVSITVFMPPALRPAIASFDVGLTTSDMVIQPAYTPSIATYTAVPSSCSDVTEAPTLFISLTLPAATFFPSTTAFTPWPATSSMPLTRSSSSLSA